MTEPLTRGVRPLPVLDRPRFRHRLDEPLRSAAVIRTLQINIGLVCNLACRHCHVESGPRRLGAHENMSESVAERVLEWIAAHPQIETVDITGGSPEMNPSFRLMVATVRELGRHVMDRCNPTIIDHVDRATGERFDWVPDFLAAHQVEVVASLPCYLEENVEYQRGGGSFARSIEGLRRLNEVGYASDPSLKLNLVYNPNGPGLPPPQEVLQEDYRRELAVRYGVRFDELWTITNMPIARWRQDLERQGQLDTYLQTLAEAFNPATVEGLMCRHQVHIDSQGRLHDCDFNHALAMRIPGYEGRHLWDVTAEELSERTIATAEHCYGCTAGAGSSCGGSLV